MRAYYDDSYTRAFSSRVIERLQVDGLPAVVLDRTYFYPTGGGQPNDLGQVGGADVLDVQTRKDDRVVVHVLSSPVADDEVMCTLDWTRRFDHMQHHTGQHILSQAFVQTRNTSTVGFHLSPDSVTIDLDRADLTEDAVAQAEDLANRIVFENRPVTTRVIDPEQVEGVRIRRLPEALATNGLRVVDIQDFDQTACGGTHVAWTGEIGLIKVTKVEKRGDKMRIEFRCGGRSLRDYRERTRVTTLLAAELTCSLADMPEAVARLRDDLKAGQRANRALEVDLMNYEAAALLQANTETGLVRWVVAAFAERDVATLRTLANALVQTPRVIALLGSYGPRSQLVLARSADLSHDMSAAFKIVSRAFDQIRGGGQPNQSQGGGPAATREEVEAVLAFAKRTLEA
ncbi:MAG: hypothetical protein IPK19_31070 [Chloroflexi bacterium]|nr:hypothetical protein [Chloroflexota bacterium]